MTPMNISLLEKINSIGLSYRQYLNLTAREIETADSAQLTEEEHAQLENKKLNLHRMKRIEKHYQVSEGFKNIAQSVDKPQLWMIISETWCGDSAQNIPYIFKIAELNPKIDLRIVLRDTNPDIMNLYLTNGTRSIPILVVFDEFGNELLKWGPRPMAAKQLVNDLITQGTDKIVRAQKLHLWYGRNKGKDLELEMTAMLKSMMIKTEWEG